MNFDRRCVLPARVWNTLHSANRSAPASFFSTIQISLYCSYALMIAPESRLISYRGEKSMLSRRSFVGKLAAGAAAACAVGSAQGMTKESTSRTGEAAGLQGSEAE